VSVAAEYRADHGGVALALRIGAQLLDARSAPRDFGGAFAFIGESGQDQSLDPVGRLLRESAGAYGAGGLAEHVNLGTAGFALNHIERRGPILDPAGNVGIA